MTPPRPSHHLPPRRAARATARFALAAMLAACSGGRTWTEAPPRLADTGLYADAATRTVAVDAIPFEPQYPLWTDGAAKRRWISLPPGTAVDARDVDDWQFPVGTRLWKQFTFATGVETRFLARRADGSWLYASYVRTPDGRDDVLAPATGVRQFCATANGRSHDVPSHADCRLCHENGRSPVLGFSALQLSGDRDPLAPNAVPPAAGALDLAGFVARGLVQNLPAAHRATPPRIAARTPTERAALGYLHGNCASCHNASGPLERLDLRLDYPLAAGGTAPAIASTLGVASRFTRGGATQRVAAGDPEHSVLFARVTADDPVTQMPPFGRHLVDATATNLIARWIREDLAVTGPSPSQPLSSRQD